MNSRSWSARVFLAVALCVALIVGAIGPGVQSAVADSITSPGPVHIGDDVSGTLASPGAHDVYTLTVTGAGASVYFQETDASCDCTWVMTGPEGEIFSQSFFDVPVTWLAAGNYTIDVTDSSPGSYAFKLWSVPDPQTFAISVGDSVSHGDPAVGAGEIESPGGQDRYTFTVGGGGQRVYLASGTDDCNCSWSLSDSTGSFEDGFTAQGMADVPVTHLAAGSYVLTVDASDASTGDYSFRLWSVPDPQSFAIAVGATVSNGVPSAGAGNIESPGAQDQYTFTIGGGGERVYLRRLSNACGCFWSLHSAAGSYRYGFDQESMATVPTTFLAAGNYVLTVDSTGSTAGTYSFSLTDVPDAQSFSISVGADVSNGVPGSGAGNIESRGAEDEYTFTVGGGGQQVELVANSNSCNCQWALRTAGGSYQNGFTAQGMADVPSRHLPADSYVLTVSANGAGTYAFTLAGVPDPAVFPISVGADVSDGVPSPGAGNIESPGAQDQYTFTIGGGGERVYLAVLGDGCGCAWSLRSTAGSYQDGFHPQGVGDVPTKFLAAGDYVLTVQGGGPSTGTYAFKLWAVPDPETFAIAIGNVVSDGNPAAGAGNIESPGAVDRYTFTVSGAGERVYAQGLPAFCSCVWSLRSASGSTQSGFGPQSMGPVSAMYLAPDNYVLSVYQPGSAPGTNYAFKLWDVPDPESFAIALGTAVSNGVPAAGAGNLESTGAEDDYTFAATGGSRIDIDATDCGASPRFTLFAPSGRRLVTGNLCDGDTILDLPAETGNYALRIVADSPDVSGAYAFSVDTSSSDPTATIPPAQAFAIAVGASVSDGVPAAGAGNIESAGSHDVYAFSATAGDVIRFDDDGTSPCCSFVWNVYAPDGTLLTGYFIGAGPIQPFVLPQTGTYTVEVSGESESETGTYGFSLQSVAAAQTFAITTNDTVTNGSPATGAGNIETADASDVYTFTGVAGQRILLVDADDSLCCSFVAALTDPEGTNITSIELGNSFDQQFTLSETGTYEIRVATVGDTVTGTYGFTLSTLPDDPVFPISIGDDVSNGVPASGAGNIESAYSHDLYSFTGVAGQQVTFDSSIGCCVYNAFVYAPDGTLLAENFLGDGGSTFTLPQSGVYTIDVSTFGATGTYSFSLTSVGDAQVFAIAIGASVSQDDPAPGAGILEGAGAEDSFLFPGTAGERVRFDDADTPASVNIQWAVYAPDGVVVAAEQFGSTPGQTFTLPASGDYTLRVTDSTTSGDYAFSLSQVPDDGVFAISIGDSVSDGVPATGAGNIEVVGAVDEYSFSATAGQRVRFDNPSSLQCCDLFWRLRAPDGSFIGATFIGEGDANVFDLEQSGTYTIDVLSDSDATGTYAFTLAAQPPPDVFAISIGQSVSAGVPGSGAGNIEVGGAHDEYTFAGTAGQLLRLTDPGTVPCCTLLWTVRAPDGSVRDSDYFGDGNGDFLIQQSGTYTIDVSAPDGIETGTYSFGLNFTVAQATLAIASDTAPIATSITSGSDAAWTITVNNTSANVAHHVTLTMDATATDTMSNTTPLTFDLNAINGAIGKPLSTPTCVSTSGGSFSCSVADVPAHSNRQFTLFVLTNGLSAGSAITGNAVAGASNSIPSSGVLDAVTITSCGTDCTIGVASPGELFASIPGPPTDDHPTKQVVTLSTNASGSTDLPPITVQLQSITPGSTNTAPDKKLCPTAANVAHCSGQISAVAGNFVKFVDKTKPIALQVIQKWQTTVPAGDVVMIKDTATAPIVLKTCVKNASTLQYNTPCVKSRVTTGSAGAHNLTSTDTVYFIGADPHFARRVTTTAEKAAATPGAPTSVTATSGNGSATVHWKAPSVNGGAAITGYIVTTFKSGVVVKTTSFGAVLQGTITGLTNAQSYSFKVAAKNAYGSGAQGAAPAMVIGAPGAPTGVTATAGAGKATVHWKAPTANGGAAITGYTVTAYKAGVLAKTVQVGVVLQATVSPLTRGVAYTFKVAAKNSRGTGVASAPSAAVKPT